MSKIYECPYCENTDTEILDYDMPCVHCITCLADGPRCDNESEAIEEWNKISFLVKWAKITKAIEDLNDVHRFDDKAKKLSEEAKETINQILEMPLDEDTDEGYKGIEGFVPGLNCTVRECIVCGCLVPGGPTRCKRCAKELDEFTKK